MVFVEVVGVSWSTFDGAVLVVGFVEVVGFGFDGAGLVELDVEVEVEVEVVWGWVVVVTVRAGVVAVTGGHV